MESSVVMADLDRRYSTLDLEIKAWIELALTSPGTLGLHVRQLGEIKRAVEALMTARKALLDACRQTAPGPDLADAYIEVLEEIVGAGELWRIYRSGIEQHSVSPFKSFVHEATLVAAELIDSVFAVAAPAPPSPAPAMIYLDPALSPSAGGRQTLAGETGFVVRRFRALKLPVPLVLVPADQSTSFWSLTHLAHEVGHNLDQELGRVVGDNHFTLTRDLKVELNATLTAANVDSLRIRRWLRWSDELLGDLFGVALGSAAFASALSNVLLPVTEARRFATLDGDAEGQSRAPHPPPILRQRVLLELLRLDGSAATTAIATAIRGDWEGIAEPAYYAELAPDIPLVASTLWSLPLKAGGPPVRSLAPFRPDARFEPLIAFLAGTSPAQPSPKLPEKLPRAHVAFASELARRKTAEGNWQGIHDRALAFSKLIAEPQFAAGGGAVDPVQARGLALRFTEKGADA